MKQRNYTPFAVHSTNTTIAGKPLVVLMVRGRFRIHKNRTLEAIEEKVSAVVNDSYFDEKRPSSLRQAGNFVSFKPHTDISLDATAHAPNHQSSKQWLAKLSIGKLSKGLKITGPRQWFFSSSFGWQLDLPNPILSLPIRYEYAYGGYYQRAGETVTFSKNPFGKSFADSNIWDLSQRIPAHQIEAPGGPVTVPGRDYQPQGFGPLDPSMRQHHHKLMSGITPYSIHNSAHPDLIYPGYLAGKETVTLENLTPDGFFRFELPGYAMLGLIRYLDGSMLPAKLVLDTLHLDLSKMIADISWRRSADASRSIRVVEFRMEQLRGRRLLAL